MAPKRNIRRVPPPASPPSGRRAARGAAKTVGTKVKRAPASSSARLPETSFQLQTIITSAPIILFALDRQGIFTLSEGKGLEGIGLRPSQLVGKSVFDMFRGVPKLKEKFRAVLRGDLRTLVDQVCGRFFETQLSLLRDERGRITGLIGVATDITDRMHAEREREAAELKYKTLVDSMSEGLLMVDNDDVILYVNDRYCEMMGYSREELLGKVALDLVLREEDRETMRRRNALRTQGISEHYELQLKTKSGEMIWVHIGAAPVVDAHGKVVGSIGVHTDITGRKKAEEFLIESDRRFRQLAEHIHGVVWMADQQKPEMLYVSKNYEIIWGRSCKSLYDNPRSLLDGIHPDDRSRVELAIYRQLEGFQTDEEYRVVRPDGTVRWVRDRGFPIKDRFGRVYRIAGVAEDITHQKQIADALRANETKLRLITSQLPAVLWTIDHNLKITSVLGAVQQHFGLDPNDFIGKTLFEIFGTDNPMFPSIVAHRGALRGKSARYEHKFRGLDFDVQVEPLRNERGEIIGAIRMGVDITERKRAERLAKESQTRFQAIVESTPALIWISGPDRLCTYFNKRWLEFTGRTMEQEIGNGWASGVHPDDLGRCLATYNSAFDERKEFSMEYRLRRFDGVYRWVLDNGMPLFAPDGSFLGYIGSCLDITDRRESEAALKASEERYRSLVENISEIYFVLDSEGRMTYCSPNMEDATGYRIHELLGKSYVRLIAAEDRARVIEFYRQRTADGTLDATIEFRGRRKDGSTEWVEQSTRIIRNIEGGVLEYRNVVRSINERKQIETELRLLAHAVESTSELICITDMEDRLTFCNRAFLQAYGYEMHELLGKRPDILGSPKNPPSISREIFEQTRCGGWKGELWNRRKDGSEFPVFLSTSLIRNDDGESIALMGVARDITDEKRVVEEIRSLATQLEQRVLERTAEIALQKNKLSRANRQLGQLIHQLQEAKARAEEASRAKTQFLTNVSHELRTPLNSVIGFANLLLKNKGQNLTPQELNYLERILGNGKHLLNIINQMLDLSKIERGKSDVELSTISLRVLIEETVAEFQGQVPEEVRVEIDIPNRLEPLRSDAGKLKQVLINLIGNALKFTQRGKVTVGVATQGADGRPVRIDVKDTGVGIPQQHLEKIFDAFQQADNSTSRQYEGTGLGLAISKALCEAMGYRIDVESQVGKGSTFSVYLKEENDIV